MAEATANVKENYCPFGCETHELDENGHCRHLVGFALHGNETFEPQKKIERFITEDDEHGKPVRKKVWTGLMRTDGRHPQPVQQGDKLVNPSFQQLDNGAWHTAYKWVSPRVYRDIDKAPAGKK